MAEPVDNKNERTWSMLCHISAFAGFVFPFGNIIAPLVIWMIKKDELPQVGEHGKEVVNFQISLAIYILIAALLSIALIGIPILIALFVFGVIVTIIGAMKANEGVFYRYPMSIRFVK
ncbi:MAG TPA: DUF4870 domain-containing protein [bacterium]|jgi:uncharacterized Tic20 family protein|nr:DUF4870 domain-containing protein [bacterium]HNT64965.1 DUF4870 domain-containing protein [bacterium]HOX84373.1 DUF4870 domain-containing protein [bacterium]HPG46030.1 DUF4870 domain-containing protein [bacterium]HPM97852.1 DUF4870 domain-containing protein [bacterium]